MASSPRKRHKSGGSGRASKRPRRTAEDGERAIAVLHREEHASAGDSYLSSRPDPAEARTVPALTTLALRRIVGAFGRILPRPPSESSNESELEAADSVRRLPPHLSTKLLVALLNATPCPLTTEHVTGLFLHGDTVSLSIPGSLTLPPLVLSQLAKSPYLRKLNVSGHASLRPRDIVPALKGLRQLEELLLAGCVKLDDSVVVAAAQAAEDRIKILNLNFTGVTTKGLVSVLARCKHLEVLKLGSVSGLIDSAIDGLFDKAIDAAVGWRHVPLSKLRCLKLKATMITDYGLGRFLSLCASTLERLDVSYSRVLRLDVLRLALFGDPSVPPPPPFECRLTKLNLSGIPLLVDRKTKLRPQPHDTLAAFLSSLASQPLPVRRRFRTLRLGVIGTHTSTGGAASAYTPEMPTRDALTIDRLEACLPSLAKLPGLRRVSLFGNRWDSQPGWSSGGVRHGLRRFVAIVGRRCEWLDLALSAGVDWVALGGLVDYHDDPLYDPEDDLDEEGRPMVGPRLETLVLDRTATGDEAAGAIAACPGLRQLFLRDTKISSGGLAEIMRGCPRLNVLDLTSCRGVPLAHRRDWFTAWEGGDVEEDLGNVSLP